MKNRFGFIPIVLPVIVMVLIIGLINLAGPQSAQAQPLGDADPKLEGLTVNINTDDNPTSGEGGDVTLTQTDGEGGFEGGFSSYNASVNYEVTSTRIVANPTAGTQVTRFTSSPSRPSTTSPSSLPAANDANYHAIVPLRVGSNSVSIRVTNATDANSYSTYRITITRSKPVLAEDTGLALRLNTTDDPDQTDGDLLIVKRPDDRVVAFHPDSTTYETRVHYHNTSTVVQADVAHATMKAQITSRIAPSSTTVSGVNYNAVVPLGVGDNRIRIKVMGKANSNEYQTYEVNVHRNAPKLQNLILEIKPGDTAFAAENNDNPAVKKFGHILASTTAEGTLAGSPDSVGFKPYTGPNSNTNTAYNPGADTGRYLVATTTDYISSVQYKRSRVRVRPTPNSGMVEVVYINSPRDADTDTGVYDLDLDPGVNSITVRARGKGQANRSYYTDYDIDITRERTPLIGAADTGIDVTVTPTGNDPTIAFDKYKTAYGVVPVEYIATGVTIAARANADTDVELVVNGAVSTSTKGKGADADAFSQTLNLPVGANPVRINTNFKKENPQTYTLTVDRAEPAPTLWFELLDGDGVPLGTDQVDLDLTSSDTPYTLNEADDGFSVDVKAVRISVYLNMASEDDVNVTLGTVEIPVNALGGGVGSKWVKHDLVAGDNYLPFDVEFRKTEGKNEFVESRHEVTIDRSGNSVPTFRANHQLDSAPHDVFHNKRIDGSEQAIKLPYATGGNGRNEYRLVGITADGSDGPLPKGLSWRDPDGMEDGDVIGIPEILDGSDKARHDLRWIVTDTDQDTSASDQSSIDFEIVIYRNQSARDDDDPKGDVAPGELIDLRVLHADEYKLGDNNNCDDNDKKSDTDLGTRDCADLEPDFAGGTVAYTATVPTDIATVDIHAVATSVATITIRGAGTNNDLQTSAKVNEAGGTRHEWNGHRIRNGSAENSYVITVNEPGVAAKTYSLTVVRKRDIAPVLPDDDKATFRYYEGTVVSEPLGSATMGNGPESLWDYTIVRRSDLAPIQTEFLGLTFSTTSSKDDVQGQLAGRAKLDTDDENLLSRYSEVEAKYQVSDADDNKLSTDKDSQDIDILVFRDVRLKSYTVAGTEVENLAGVTKGIPADWPNNDQRDWVYSHETLPAYVYTGLAYDANNVTFRPVVNNADAEWEITSHSDASSDAGYQIALTGRNNPVTVKVTNGKMYATHVINLTRPGLFLESLKVNEDEGTKDNGKEVELDPKFNATVNHYEATAPLWVESVKIYANPKDPRATVSVDGVKTPSVGFWEVDLEAPGVARTLEIIVSMGATVSTQETATTTLIITRETDSQPVFNGEVEVADKYEVGKALSIKLPTAKDGNGTLTCSLNEEELPPGLSFSAGANCAAPTISGTPTLAQAYESEFELTLTVKDSDNNTAATDTDSRDFTLVITRDSVPTDGDSGTGLPAGEAANTLNSITVEYDQGTKFDVLARLDPTFSPAVTKYTVEIPHDATNSEITAKQSHSGSGLRINGIRIVAGDRVILKPETTIKVVPPADSGLTEMVYTVTMVVLADTNPVFSTTVTDKDYQAGDSMSLTLPAVDAGTGNGNIGYTLVDRQNALPKGLSFNANTRTLSGAPQMVDGADKAKYEMTYTATDENGDTATLKFMITTCAPGSDYCESISDATLSALSLSGITLDTPFSPDTTAYTANVDYDTMQTMVSATANNPRATVSAPAGMVALAVGPNAISVTVTASNGVDTMTYTVMVTRAESSDATLSSLSLGDTMMTPAFDAMTTAYTAEVEYDTMQVTVSATANYSGATVSVSPSETVALEVGDNAITVTVTAADGMASMTYNITVTRNEQPNQGVAPIDLAVSRDGESATLTWVPGAAAAKQAVVAFETDGTLSQKLATFGATYMEIGADADTHIITGLTEGVDYTYMVIGYDADGNYKDASGNLYFARYHEKGN